MILDDAPWRHKDVKKIHLKDEVYSCYNIWDAQEMVKTHHFDLIYCDFDLNDYGLDSVISSGENTLKLTGEDFISYMLLKIPKSNWPQKIIITSTDDRGAAEIEWILKQVGIPTERMPLID